VLVLSNLWADQQYDGEAVDEDDGDDVVECTDRRLAVLRRTRLSGGVRQNRARRHVARSGQHGHQWTVAQAVDSQTKLDRLRHCETNAGFWWHQADYCCCCCCCYRVTSLRAVAASSNRAVYRPTLTVPKWLTCRTLTNFSSIIRVTSPFSFRDVNYCILAEGLGQQALLSEERCKLPIGVRGCSQRFSSNFILSWHFCILGNADGGHEVGILRPYVCVCLFSARYFKILCSSDITKLDTEIFHHESWKPIYFGVKRSKSRVTKSLPAWVFALFLVHAAYRSYVLSVVQYGPRRWYAYCLNVYHCHVYRPLSAT